jgi:L-lactate dehydrogenase complex protein LldE
MRLRTQPTSKSVQLMLTCLADAFYHTVGRATVEVLEHAGCTVEFPENQTCCGQPAFNAGDWAASGTPAAFLLGQIPSWCRPVPARP